MAALETKDRAVRGSEGSWWDGSDSKEPAHNAGGPGLIPGLEKSGKPLQYSCLENHMDRGAWQATVPWGRKESDTTERLTLFTLRTPWEGSSGSGIWLGPPQPVYGLPL